MGQSPPAGQPSARRRARAFFPAGRGRLRRGSLFAGGPPGAPSSPPARSARDVAVAVATIAGGGLYLAWNLTLRQTIGSFTPRHQPDLSNLVSSLQRIEWLPSSWPGHALSAVIEGNTSSALVWTGVT